MVSGVSFKKPADYTKTVKKSKSISTGLLLSFLLLIIVAGAYGGAWYLKSEAHKESIDLKKSVSDNAIEIAQKLSGAPAEIVGKSQAIRSMLHTDRTTADILLDAHQFAVPGVVFQSFGHEYDAGTGMSTITVIADADSYDSLAAQIKEWKDNPLYSKVRVKDVAQSEESRFIVFNVTMETLSGNIGPYGEGVLSGTKDNTDAQIEEIQDL